MASGRTVVHLVRHGEVANPLGLRYGRLPGFSLAPSGHAHVTQTARYLCAQDPRPRVLVAGPLTRAQETAALIAPHLGLSEFATDARLTEAGSRYEGLPRRFAPGHYVARWLAPVTGAREEPLIEVAIRMRAAVLDCVRALPDGGAAVMVSHQTPIWLCRIAFERGLGTASAERAAQWFPWMYRAEVCRYASVTTLVLSGESLAQARYWEPRG